MSRCSCFAVITYQTASWPRHYDITTALRPTPFKKATALVRCFPSELDRDCRSGLVTFSCGLPLSFCPPASVSFDFRALRVPSMARSEKPAFRKASAPTPELDSIPWVDDVAFAFDESVPNGHGPTKDSRRPSSKGKRDTPRIDLTRLFTRRKSSKNSDHASPFEPTTEVAYDLLDTSTPRDWQQTTNQWGVRIRKTKSTIATDILNPYLSSLDLNGSGFQSPKIHIRKPPPGIQYWFDGVEDDDTALIKSDPDGFLPDRNRDTFLSTSTDQSRHSAQAPVPPRTQSEPLAADSALEQMDYFSMSTASTRPRTSTVTASPKAHSHRRSSISTICDMDKPLVAASCVREQLPASIDRGQSVLVLSETDESEDDDVRSTQRRISLDEITMSSFRNVTQAESPEEENPGRQHHTNHVVKRFNSVPDLISATSIEEGSQMSVDDHSPRTSLLSDLRPISFRSEYRPLSFKIADRPISIQTFESDDPNAWLASPTATLSGVTSPPDFSQYSSESCAPVSRSQSTQRRCPSAKPQRVMAVTDEEARLLSCMRRRRVEMEQGKPNPHNGEDGQRQPCHSDHSTCSRPPTANRQSCGDSTNRKESSSDIFEADDDVSLLSAKIGMVRKAALLSSCSARPKDERRPSTDTVARVWEDVQQWRKRPLTPPPRDACPQRRPSSHTIESATDKTSTYVRSRFSIDSSSFSPRSGATLSRQVTNETAIKAEASTGLGDRPPVLPRNDYGQSLGEALRERDMTDVQADVLAAWNDLGGWRRSMMSGNSVF